MTEELAAEVARLRAIQRIERLPDPLRQLHGYQGSSTACWSCSPNRSRRALAGKGREGVRAFYTQALLGVPSQCPPDKRWTPSNRPPGAYRSRPRRSRHGRSGNPVEGRWQRLVKLSYDHRYVLEDGLWRSARRKLSFRYRDAEGRPAMLAAITRRFRHCRMAARNGRPRWQRGFDPGHWRAFGDDLAPRRCAGRRRCGRMRRHEHAGLHGVAHLRIR